MLVVPGARVVSSAPGSGVGGLSADDSYAFLLVAVFRLAFFGAAFFGFFAEAEEAPSKLISFVPMGEPRPVQASQPGPAEKAPLLPEVMSWKADLAFAV